jgi:hypothetical protein
MHSSISPQISRSFSLGSHNRNHAWGFSPWGMLFVCAASVLGVAPPVQAQTATCGLTSIAYKNELVYPPIAKVAHIEGTVILMVRFEPDGNVEHITKLSGQLMLQNAAASFLKDAQANEYSGPRECPLVVTFHLVGPTDRECSASDEQKPAPATPEIIDPQHISISRQDSCISVDRDPSPFLIHHFLFLHWYSKH